MATSTKSMFLAALLALSIGMSTTASAGTLTPSPVMSFTTTDASKDQVLSNASPNFTADLSTYTTFKGQVHSLIGDMFGDTEGVADFEHQADDGPDPVHGDITLPYAMVGRNADGENATILYKFVVEPGFQTAAGSVIAADVYFRHDPLSTNHGYNAWIGVNPTATVDAALSTLLNDSEFQRTNMKDFFGPDSSGFASYVGEVLMEIPAGLSEFYIAFSDTYNGPGTPPTHSSARFAFSRLEVNAMLEEADSLEGDYNFDLKVDAADYTVWRDDPDANGGAAGYSKWKSNFGASATGASAASSAVVPEPLSLLLIASGLLLLIPLRIQKA